MKLFKRNKNQEIDDDLTKWLEHTDGYSMLHLFSSGLGEWDLGISQHGDSRTITVLIPPIHFKDEVAIKTRIKELIIEYNYFCQIEVRYGISSSHHFVKETDK